MKYLLAALALLTARVEAAPSRYGYEYHGLAIDLGAGVAIPAADSDYTKNTDVSFKLQLHVGYEIPVHKMVLVAPELSFAFIPVNTDDATFQDNHVDANFQRYRFLAGGRIGLRLGRRVVPYLRIGLGVDHVSGKTTVAVPVIGSQTTSFSSTAFVFEPGLGVQVEIIKHLIAGGVLDFPIAAHDFGKVFGQSQKFTAFDVEIVGYLGYRY
jgi:opacity protein-like surface antigen